MIVKLTPEFIEKSLRCPDGKRRTEYVDKGGIGLYIEVRSVSEGQGTYYLRYKDAAGKTCHQKIGRTTDMDLDEARSRSKTIRAQVILGADPRGEEKAKMAILTFDEFFQNHYMPHARAHKRSWKDDLGLYRLRLTQAFGRKRLNQIGRQEIELFHVSLRNDGLSPAYADAHLRLVKHALNLAVDWDMLEKNPCSRVHLFNVDNKVENYLEGDELERLLKVLQRDKNRTVCSIAIFLLSTGARLNEALQAKWKDIDRKNRVFRILAINSKSKKMRSVPLNDTAIDVLNRMDEKVEYVFTNRKTGKPYTTIHKVWERLRKDAGLPHLRIHDLRHSFASYLVGSGRTLYEVQLALGHSSPTVTQRYAHLSSKSLLAAANSASDIISEAMKKSA